MRSLLARLDSLPDGDDKRRKLMAQCGFCLMDGRCVCFACGGPFTRPPSDEYNYLDSHAQDNPFCPYVLDPMNCYDVVDE